MNSSPDKSSGTVKRHRDAHSHGVSCLAFSPDGRTLASASTENRAELWAIADGELRQTLEGHTQRIRSLAFHPNGITLASGSNDRTVKLWDVADGRLLATLGRHSDWVTSVAFRPQRSDAGLGQSRQQPETMGRGCRRTSRNA